MSGERALWAAVLYAAVEDARRGRDAEYLDSRDFRLVCTFAGLDPDAVADRLAPTAAPPPGKAA